MTILFLTGLSGVGKSSVLSEMKIRGHKTVDLDYGFVRFENNERLFDETKIRRLLKNHQETNLILAGTESNQGQFYSDFDEIILLTADLNTMLERIQKRTSNPYGKSEKEQAAIIENYDLVLPLLKNRATLVIDTTHKSIKEVSDQLENLFKNK